MPKESFLKLPEEKQRQIIQESINYLLHIRFEDMNIQHLAEKCGISKGSFYYYFQDRVDFYLYIFEILSYHINDFTVKVNLSSLQGLFLYLLNVGNTVSQEYMLLLYRMTFEMSISSNEYLRKTIKEYDEHMKKRIFAQLTALQKFHVIREDTTFETVYSLLLSTRYLYYIKLISIEHEERDSHISIETISEDIAQTVLPLILTPQMYRQIQSLKP